MEKKKYTWGGVDLNDEESPFQKTLNEIEQLTFDPDTPKEILDQISATFDQVGAALYDYDDQETMAEAAELEAAVAAAELEDKKAKRHLHVVRNEKVNS